MAELINAFVVLDREVDASLVEAAIPAGGQVVVSGFVRGPEETERALRDMAADVLVLACFGASERMPDVVRSATAELPNRPVVVLSQAPPAHLVERLIEAGADDVIILPETPEHVLFALEKAAARHRGHGAEAPSTQGPMILMLGPKGGTGKTVAASNLAVGLAGAGNRTAVVDLDLQFGDMGLALGLRPERTLYDLATSGGGLDAEKLAAYLQPHGTHLEALLAPVRPDQASAVSIELLREVFELLRSSHDVLVVDTPPDFTPEVIAAIDVSSDICMIAALDSLSLKNTKLGLETLELMGYDRNSITLVLNRANSQVGITHADFQDIIGRPADVLVPSDRSVPRSLNEGEPILLGKPRSPVAAAYRELMLIYQPGGAAAGVPEAIENGRPRRRFRLIPRRKREG